ncbi:GFA family protein [Anderseniella sp. Alg231-50]|uniref:GFA family protein n=1 Tax=Anderseniella sp. Alg231-50 TaxID=1922226 RepID=UPI000D551CA4
MTKQAIPVHKGGCHCGSIRYQATGNPVIVAHCHCEDCQRLSGTGHATGAMFAAENFQLEGRLSEYTLAAENGNQVTKAFCPNCGSQVLGRNSGSPSHVTVSLGTMDDSSMLEPQVAIFARNRKPWDMMDETIATFDDQPAWKPDSE